MKTRIAVPTLRIPFVGRTIADRLRFAAGTGITLTGAGVLLAQAVGVLSSSI